ncbi:cytochrome c1 [Haematospirillum sp. H1815]|uniref:cytochrome c1 n=1 Tax=Haematospirillum sp. H1815 TaxID=2723108 RepID=UPI00143A0232|nr:cytochrome c1 [Haematospirillum sp. H1815]NKD78023.1 cytochrome c1 [Haematospirillum sp. H1815]
MQKLLIAAVVALGWSVVALLSPAYAAGNDTKLVTQPWSWQGVFGHYDRAQLRRGLQVYQEVCATCHSLKLIRYRNLAEIGLTEDEIKDYAAAFEYQDGFDDSGEPKIRPGIPADPIKAPYPNDQAARAANGGALPPDLSLMAKARPHGPDYLFTLLTSYEEPPKGTEVMAGMYYNPAFPGHQIGMPQMIYDETVTYTDGSPNTAAAISRDIVAFLNWSAEPELEARKSLGVKVMIFLLVMTALFYALKRQIWKDVEH